MHRRRNVTARSQQACRLALRRAVQLFACGAAALSAVSTGAVAANQARISGLSDVAFGSISSFTVDSLRSQSLCLYSKSPPTNNYRITASGSGAGGAFLLSSGSDTLPYEVEWSDISGQTSGTELVANQPLTAQHSSVGGGDPGDCSRGLATTASLVVILRSAALAAATSGTYSGTLTLVVAPE